MDKKVHDHSDELRDLIDLGPEHNPEILRKALGIVQTLRAAAPWSFPQQILDDLKERLPYWFGERRWRGDQAQVHCDLLEDLATLQAFWDCPSDDSG